MMEQDVAEIAAGFCQGNIGQAIRFAQSEDFQIMKNQVMQLLKQIDDLPLSSIMEIVHGFSKEKGNFYDYLDLMLLWYRDILMYKATKDTNAWFVSFVKLFQNSMPVWLHGRASTPLS